MKSLNLNRPVDSKYEEIPDFPFLFGHSFANGYIKYTILLGSQNRNSDYTKLEFQ